MSLQSTQQITASGKTGGMPLCADGVDWAILVGTGSINLSYLGSKETVISNHAKASEFTTRNPRNPEADS
jgi:hypothetical protein